MKLGKSRFHGFPILGMMDRKAEDQSSSRTTTRAKPWYGCKDFVLFSIHHSLNLKFRSMFLLFSYWKLVDYHFFNPILPQNLLITNLNFRTKISKKKHCASSQQIKEVWDHPPRFFQSLFFAEHRLKGDKVFIKSNFIDDDPIYLLDA